MGLTVTHNRDNTIHIRSRRAPQRAGTCVTTFAGVDLNVELSLPIFPAGARGLYPLARADGFDRRSGSHPR